MDQAEYQRQYDDYEARYHETQRRIAEVEASREALTAKRGKLKGYFRNFVHQEQVGQLAIVLYNVYHA